MFSVLLLWGWCLWLSDSVACLCSLLKVLWWQNVFISVKFNAHLYTVLTHFLYRWCTFSTPPAFCVLWSASQAMCPARLWWRFTPPVRPPQSGRRRQTWSPSVTSLRERGLMGEPSEHWASRGGSPKSLWGKHGWLPGGGDMLGKGEGERGPCFLQYSCSQSASFLEPYWGRQENIFLNTSNILHGVFWSPENLIPKKFPLSNPA